MKKQTKMKTYRFIVKNKKNVLKDNNIKDMQLLQIAKKKGFDEVLSISSHPLYFVKGELTETDIDLLKDVLFCDNVFQYCEAEAVEAQCTQGCVQAQTQVAEHKVEVLVKSESADSTHTETIRICNNLSMAIEDFVSGCSYSIEGNITKERLENLAKTMLLNPINEYYSLHRITPIWQGKGKSPSVLTFDIAKMSDAELLQLSEMRRLSLNLQEMQSIRSYYSGENRPCTDAELEMIAQSWSEHCVHKTFKANISFDASVPESECSVYPETVRGVLKTYIKKATDEIAKPWVISSFVDNAGIIELDDEWEVSFKVETHNHPSSLEPFCGANTGVGGVIRDIMGVSAKPIAATDVLCFAPHNMDVSSLPEGTISPCEMAKGVIEGIRDYGNKMGIPTVSGDIHYHELYATNPLVYCGCVGLAPRGKHKREQKKGDHIIALGKRTGRDGIGGATFSSMEMGKKLENPPVQKGEPIIEKKVMDALLKMRDASLYSAITDCGAGGFSSSVGEMASVLGCDVELCNAKTKYEGLAPYEIWISETQERMVIAVPPQNVSAILSICDEYDVEASDLGFFTGEERIKVKWHGKSIIDLSCKFLDEGLPTREIVACYEKHNIAQREYSEPSLDEALEKVLGTQGILSKEQVVKGYDHEVQGATVLKPFMGEEGKVGQVATVLKPLETQSNYAVAISSSMHEREAMEHPYRATLLSIDEAIRRLVCVGCDPDRIALLDNFCLGSSKDASVIWDLLEMGRACYDGAKAFGTPFISGKDSFNNEYKKNDGTSIAIPPSLLISAIGRVQDVELVVSSVLKTRGSFLYLVGKPDFAFGASLFSTHFGIPCCVNSQVAGVCLYEAPTIYASFYECIKKKLFLSTQIVGRGGIAKALHKMSVGERLTHKLVDNLARAVGASSLLQAMFGETSSCFLVEVDVQNIDIFEKTMDERYRIKIGEVVSR